MSVPRPTSCGARLRQTSLHTLVADSAGLTSATPRCARPGSGSLLGQLQLGLALDAHAVFLAVEGYLLLESAQVIGRLQCLLA